MNEEQIKYAVAWLDDLQAGDPEGAHEMADDFILGLLPMEVQRAHARLVNRAAWWAFA